MLHKKESHCGNEGLSDEARVKVVLCWHMHQPQYQDQITKQFVRPWTYLHAIKDYIDMASIIQSHPKARAVFNFSPVLLEQIVAYADNIQAYFVDNEAIIDPALAALINPVVPSELSIRRDFIRQCLQIHEERLIKRFLAFNALVNIAKNALQDDLLLAHLDVDFFTDLITWFHLAWMGETVRDNCIQLQSLIAKGKGFSLNDRRDLLAKIGEIIAQVIPLYRSLAKSKQIEISVTPDKHPIIPLLIDFGSARDAMPDAPLPLNNYPGGAERAKAHIQKSLTLFEDFFGFRPSGCWPSEGGLCDASLQLLADEGFQWTASGDGVLQNSLKRHKENNSERHQAVRVGDIDISCFFRDDNLSDDIGFNFSRWGAEDAVSHLLFHIGNIRTAAASKKDCVVPILLDGENCWESYEKNGFHFLNLLYERFSQHPDIDLTTFADVVASKPKHQAVASIVAGSWVYGTFSTWIGEASKNRAWEILCSAKRAYDQAIESPDFPAHLREKAEYQLAVCEGSDWFWWFGDYNSAGTVAEFDALFRLHVRNLYQLIGIRAPGYLDHPISIGSGDPENSGTMRRSKAPD